VSVYFGQLLENYLSIVHIWANLFHGYISLSISLEKKVGWATFWVIFPQTHPVTLVGANISTVNGA
jgi:hypothetical protein